MPSTKSSHKQTGSQTAAAPTNGIKANTLVSSVSRKTAFRPANQNPIPARSPCAAAEANVYNEYTVKAMITLGELAPEEFPPSVEDVLEPDYITSIWTTMDYSR